MNIQQQLAQLDEMEQILALQPTNTALSQKYWDTRRQITLAAEEDARKRGTPCACDQSVGTPGKFGKYVCRSCHAAYMAALVIVDECAKHYPDSVEGLDEAYRCLAILADKDEPEEPLKRMVCPPDAGECPQCNGVGGPESTTICERCGA